MRISLPYHGGAFEIDLSRCSRVEVVGDSFPEPLPEPGKEIRRALSQPVDCGTLQDILPERGKISVLISDLTRGGGVGRALTHILAFLEEGGAGPDRVEIFLSMGMHRGHSGAELEAHLGREIVHRYRVLEHDATDYSSLVDVGVTPAGTPCLFNRGVVDSALVLGIGSVSFHYFAGYGGGRKLILPGVAGERTILANHRLSLKDDPGDGLSEGCRPGSLDGNPVSEDMLAGARLLPTPVFIVNLVTDKLGRALFVNAGELDKAHRGACGFLQSNFIINLDRSYEAVIASAGGFPKDINLLQSHKALRHASYALGEGGLLLAAAACPEAVGSPSYLDAFRDGRGRVPENVRKDYTLNAQAAISTHELTGRYSIYLKSLLSDEEISLFGFHPWDIGRTDDLLEGVFCEDILVILNASYFLPLRPSERDPAPPS